eukprot:4516166-Pleurochrysis_carterae.AAC.1
MDETTRTEVEEGGGKGGRTDCKTETSRCTGCSILCGENEASQQKGAMHGTANRNVDVKAPAG